jgi:predicted nucleotidyltransferase
MSVTHRIPLDREEEVAQKFRDFHDHNMTLLPEINSTLFAAIAIIEEKNIPYALFGGMAGKELGRPRMTHDIDIFIRPDDADTILELLKSKGFETEKRDPLWLYKAWKDEVLVDLIFRSCGDIYFEEEVRSHVRRIPYEGKYINTIGPEDFIVIKCAAHREDNPHHWYDALSVLKQGKIDWDYLIKRARYCPRRVLSLLIYAESNDIAIPFESIHKLYQIIFDRPVKEEENYERPYLRKKMNSTVHPHFKSPPSDYLKGSIMDSLRSDERIPEHDLKVLVTESSIIVKGEVFNEEQKEAVSEVLRKVTPDREIINLLKVRVLYPPESSEAIS